MARRHFLYFVSLACHPISMKPNSLKHFVFLVAIFCTSVGIAMPWDKDVLTEYSKAKTYKELFCGVNRNALSCKEFQKSLGDRFTVTPLKLKVEGADTVIIQGTHSQVRIARKSETKYLLNGRYLDLAEIQNREELRNAFRKAIPKQVAGGPFWISRAWAQTSEPVPGVIDEEIMAGLTFLVERSQVLTTCKAVSAFVDTCIDKAFVMGLALGQTDEATKGVDPQEKELQVEVAKAYLVKMKKLSANLKKADTPLFRAKIDKCSQERPELSEIFKACVSDVRTFSQVLERMKSDMDTEFLDEAVQDLAAPSADYEALEFFASPKGGNPAKSKSKAGQR